MAQMLSLTRLGIATELFGEGSSSSTVNPNSIQRVSTICATSATVLLLLFLATGLRVSEMAPLDRSTIVIEQHPRKNPGKFIVLGVGEVVGKGNKRRTFYVNEKALFPYLRYQGAQGRTSGPPPFRAKTAHVSTCNARALGALVSCGRRGSHQRSSAAAYFRHFVGQCGEGHLAAQGITRARFGSDHPAASCRWAGMEVLGWATKC